MQLMLVVLFMMGLHSTVLQSRQVRDRPEILPDRDLSRGNALLEMTTLMGIVLGGAMGFSFSPVGKERAAKWHWSRWPSRWSDF